MHDHIYNTYKYISYYNAYCIFILIIVLQNELSTDFEEATVEWVDCPDLTDEPFNLAAPGKRFDV